MRFEANQPLDQSLLWKWQHRFYDRLAEQAWVSGTVPWRITSTPVLADGLAQVIAAFASDTQRSGQRRPEQPVCLLDLGAGTGRLAALLCDRLSDLGVPFEMVLTDLAASNIEAWQRHPRLKALATAGQLDFAVADSSRSEALGLLNRGTVWEPGRLPGPLVAIATYLFDTLPHALWRKRAGALEEGLVTLSAETDPRRAEPPTLAELAWEFSFSAPRRAVPAFVHGYAATLGESPFLVPVGAFACLEALAHTGGGRCLCLAVDKGPRSREQLAALPFPPLARHGTVSASVNFHALRAWAGYRPWFEAAHPDAALGVYGVATGHLTRELGQTRGAFSEAFGGGTPLAEELALQAVVASGDAATGAELLDALVAQRCGPDAFLRLANGLRAKAATVAPSLRPVLARALARVEQNHFELGEDADLAFEVATVLHRASQLEPAIGAYQRSLAARGEHATTRFNLALCWLDLGKRVDARRELERVLALAPAHPRARALLDEVRA